MGACCKSDAIQSHKHKAKFERYAKQNTWETHKDKRIARHTKLVAKQAPRMITPHGTARAQRRATWLSAIEGGWTSSYRKSFQDYEARL